MILMYLVAGLLCVALARLWFELLEAIIRILKAFTKGVLRLLLVIILLLLLKAKDGDFWENFWDVLFDS